MKNDLNSITRLSWILFTIGMILCWAPGFFGISWAAPKRLEGVKAGNCAACHEGEKVLPAGHVNTADLAGGDCKACHRTGPLALRGKIPLSHVHQQGGIGCAPCHGKTGTAKAPAQDQCATCHGSPDGLAKKTAKVKPENPHTSPHYGTSLDCNLCHHQHARSENFCAQCHDFKFVVP